MLVPALIANVKRGLLAVIRYGTTLTWSEDQNPADAFLAVGRSQFLPVINADLQGHGFSERFG
jgi:hypothetical protein